MDKDPDISNNTNINNIIEPIETIESIEPIELTYPDNFNNNNDEDLWINSNPNQIIPNDILINYLEQLDINLILDYKYNLLDTQKYYINNFNNDISINRLIEDQKNSIENEDPWENSINDNKFYINNRIARIFPQIKNYSFYSKIKIDDESFSYITIREIADLISKIISHHLLQFNVNPQKSSIIDYTSGVGGNVLSFSKYFNMVYAVELSSLRAEYLKNNIDVYGYKNIKVINDSSIDFNESSMISINPNVIFVDPPWGGSDYKNSEILRLKLGDTLIEDLILNIINKFENYYNNIIQNISDPTERLKMCLNNHNNKLIVLKLPKNYDIEHYYNCIKKINSKYYLVRSYLYILNKMLIIITELSFIYT